MASSKHRGTFWYNDLSVLKRQYESLMKIAVYAEQSMSYNLFISITNMGKVNLLVNSKNST